MKFKPGDEVVDKYGEPAEVVAVGYSPDDPWSLQMYWVKLESWTIPQWRDEGFLRTKSAAAAWLKQQIISEEEAAERSTESHRNQAATYANFLKQYLPEFE